jgi:S1-C subfamily serine protease
MSEQPGHGSAGARGTAGRGYSAIPVGFGSGGDGERTSEFGKFDWFTEFDDFGRAGRASGSQIADGRQIMPSQSALDDPLPAGGRGAGGLPAGAAADDGTSEESDGDKRGWFRRRPSRQWGERQRAFGRGDRRADGWLADRRKERGLGRWLRGWRLAVAAVGLATACTLVGGVLGGFVVLHGENKGLSDSSYSLGSVPRAVTNRPATSVAGIAARDTPAVVMIKVNDGQGTGSGFLIQGGYIVTDNHVVTLDGVLSGASLRVYFSNGKSARGVLVGRDPYSDIAVIKAVGVTNLPALTLGDSKAVAVGDPVIAIGSPLGLADTVTSGIVSAVDRPVQPSMTAGTTQVFFDAIQTDAPINPGNSGGPLVNARGQVIGMDAAIDTLGNDPITGSQGGSIGLGFAIPMDQARRVVEQLIRTGHATHSVMGAAINENFTGNGAQVMTGHGAVAPRGPAARAGLKPGDIIIKAGSQPISNAYGLMDAIRSQAPGSHVALTFLRQGQTHQTELALGSASS